ncbi:MAG TPA: addiction module protein [Candidatus Paceibacterota bacterium]|nr:addiction module protein [Verrucomicrobiota bacterium]HRY49519.1 addiction module protein [Candidatus Paceibacterota bacterium]
MSEIDHLRTLPVSERIQLVEDLWDTIASDPSGVELSAAQRDELERRLDRWEGSPTEGVEWSVLRTRIQNSV